MATVDRDPAGLLARVPELETLALRHEAIRRAIERGALPLLYRRLWWLRLARRAGEDRDLVGTLLAHRRLFVAPIRRAPTLATLNGIGARVYGADDRDERDDTYITTHYATVLWVPVFPVASYLVVEGVRDGGPAWQFMGKVPLAMGHWFWQRLFALSVVVGVAVAAYSAHHAAGHNELRVANGLPFDVTVRVGSGEPLAVPGNGGIAAMELATGPYAIDVESDGRSIEKGRVDITAGTSVIAWNVLGAAPLFSEKVVYQRDDLPRGRDAKAQIFCGERSVRVDDVDDVFVEPPASLKVSGGSAVRVHVGLAPGGLMGCVSYLLGENRSVEAARLTADVAAGAAYELGSYAAALGLGAAYASKTDVVALAERGRAAHDDSIEHHRAYQHALLEVGERSRLVAEYEQRAAAAPDSADAAYLLARVEPESRVGPFIDGLVARHAEHAYLRRVHLHHHFLAGDHALVVESSSRLAELEDSDRAQSAANVARSFVVLGRGTEALAFVERIAAGVTARQRVELAELYARVAGRVPGSDAAVLLRTLEKESDEAVRAALQVARQRLGLLLPADRPPEQGPLGEAIALEQLAGSAPEKALARAERSSALTLARLDRATAALLYCEALRLGSPTAARLGAALEMVAGEGRSALEALVIDGDEAGLAEIDPELRAAGHFVRSREASVGTAEQDALVARAREEDILGGPVTRAIEGWK